MNILKSGFRTGFYTGETYRDWVDLIAETNKIFERHEGIRGEVISMIINAVHNTPLKSLLSRYFTQHTTFTELANNPPKLFALVDKLLPPVYHKLLLKNTTHEFIQQRVLNLST